MTGKGRAAQAESVDVLFAPDCSDNEYFSFQNALDSLSPSEFGVSWGELLPLLSRDQECGFGSLTAWRSAQSESDSPSPQQRDASRIIRAVLGLFRHDEVETADRLSQLKKDVKSAQNIAEQIQQTPELECAIIAKSLYANLGLPCPEKPMPMDTEIAVSSKQKELDEQIKKQEQVVDDLAEKLAQYAVELKNRQFELDILAGKVVPKQQLVLDNKTGDRDERYHKLKALELDKCRYTNYPLLSCNAYIDHLRLLESRLSKSTAQDFQNQAEYERHLMERRELETAINEKSEIITYLTTEMESTQRELQKARLQLTPLYRKKELREQLLEDFKASYQKITPDVNPELSGETTSGKASG